MKSLLTIRRARPEIAEATPEAVADARARLRAAIADTPQRVERDADSDAQEVRATVTPLDTRDGSRTGTTSRHHLRWLGAAASVVAVTAAAIVLPGTAEMPVMDGPAVEVTPVPDSRPSPAVRGAKPPPARAPFGTFGTVTSLEHHWSGDGGSTTVTRPDAPGPWPIVILFGDGIVVAPGAPATTSVAGQERSVAEVLASAGLMVAVIDWDLGDDATVEDLELASSSLACAVAGANQGASEDGGDPRRVATVGWGPTAAAAVHSATTAAAPRWECIQPLGAYAELVIAIDPDLGPLPDDETADWARFNRNKPLLFLGSENDAATAADVEQLVSELSEIGYKAKAESVAAPGSITGDLQDADTRRILDRIVDAAHEIER